VFVAFVLAGVVPLFIFINNGLVGNTVGTLSLAAYGVLIGAVALAPLAILLFRRTPEFTAMNFSNALTCQGIIVLTAGIICYCLLLRLNAPAANAPTFKREASVFDARHPKTGAWKIGALEVQVEDYGSREVAVSAAVWQLATNYGKIRLVLAPGRLGHPVVIGCEVNGIEGIQRVFR
jgi:hypothetical protein